ncbi:class A beta-lactamase [Tsuneonella mangrovi]|uniref:class A beta-lactamase n=1 Tax=Tsuneonella mangrovi TaxID=1982042 RepID=UPI00196ADEDA|nr:class A beta-lactamase [Tsuneonella mangrovi]
MPVRTDTGGRIDAKLHLIEVANGGALGAALLDPLSGDVIGNRADERFALCSTFKASLVALVLDLGIAGKLDLGEVVYWTQADLLSYAPFAKQRLANGATITELAGAAQILSDNTAANLLLQRVGGPEGLTAFWRSLGDEVSRLDDIEGALNHVLPGSERNTTTPRAMATTLAKILYSGAIAREASDQLKAWMRETQTGAKKVRAGLPQGWDAGDKTGNSGGWPDMYGVSADIGFAVPPNGAPIIFAAYHRAAALGAPSANADAALAQVGEAIGRLP